MHRKGWILFLILLGVAFLVSRGNHRQSIKEKAELVLIMGDEQEQREFKNCHPDVVRHLDDSFLNNI